MKTRIIASLLLIVSPVYAGLYDDILNEPNGNTLKSKYAQCQDRECIERVHQENMEVLNQCERSMMYLMYENQIQNSPKTPLKIQYGYNAQGNYVPTSIGGENIHYGYNAFGEYVPMSIGD